MHLEEITPTLKEIDMLTRKRLKLIVTMKTASVEEAIKALETIKYDLDSELIAVFKIIKLVKEIETKYSSIDHKLVFKDPNFEKNLKILFNDIGNVSYRDITTGYNAITAVIQKQINENKPNWNGLYDTLKMMNNLFFSEIENSRKRNEQFVRDILNNKYNLEIVKKENPLLVSLGGILLGGTIVAGGKAIGIDGLSTMICVTGAVVLLVSALFPLIDKREMANVYHQAHDLIEFLKNNKDTTGIQTA